MFNQQVKKIVVTGGGGQLAQCIGKHSSVLQDYEFLFLQKRDLDITSATDVSKLLGTFKPDVVINTAAYTQVDKAEQEQELAFLINAEAVKMLAHACYEHQVMLIHISTDYVFNGKSNIPHKENDLPDPQTVYGRSKYAGENEILKSALQNFFILRTSWLYSEFGHNFYKTMQKLSATRDQLSVVDDQMGSPTNANDLASGILRIIAVYTSGNMDVSNYGIYNFANGGSTSWYGFAKAIFQFKKVAVDLQPTSSEAYPTAARRPAYSMLDSHKFEKTFNFEIPHWKESLKNLVESEN